MKSHSVVGSDEAIEIVWPLGQRERVTTVFADRLDDLSGKTVAEIWSWMWGGDVAFAVIREELKRRYPDITIIPYTEFGNIHGPDENAVVAGLGDELKRRGVDAAILGIANCGSCTPAVLRAHVAVERAGIPAVSIVGAPFIDQATAVAEYLNVAGAAMAVYPGNIEADSKDLFRRKVTDNLPDPIVAGLKTGSISTAEAVQDPAPREIVFRGSLDAVQDHVERMGWGDGLPVVPPTLERVEAFLSFTPRAPDEVLGRLLPAGHQATIWNVAVNGVMAGCRPEYMPILAAAAEIICDPAFRLEDQGASPAWEMLLTVSGPIARELDFNAQHGVCASGRRANTSIGRFLRLYSRNIAGHRIPPGVTDYAAVGNNFCVAIAEDEARLRDLGWATDGEEQGLAPGESGVTVQGIVAASPTFFYFGGDDGDPTVSLAPLRDVFGTAICGYWGFTGATYGHWHPLVLLNPDMAASIAAHGWTKDDVRRFLYEGCRISAAELERRGGVMNLDLADQVRRGVLPPVYHESDDAERMVPLFVRPEWIRVVVAGAPTTCFRGYMNNHEQGVPATRKVQLPADWAARIAQRG